MSKELAVQEDRALSPLQAILSEPERLKELPMETIERLFALQKEQNEERSRQAFHTAFNAVQNELVPVAKKGYNTHTKSAYALAADVVAMLNPILVKHGFSRSFSNDECPHEDHLRFVLTLRHTGGHVERHWMDAPVDDAGTHGKKTKTRIQGMASSMTYCERHLLCKVFGLQIGEDNDGNKTESAEAISDEQCLQLESLIEQSGTNLQRFKDYFKIEAVADLPESRFAQARRDLERKLKEKENA